jgi:hypothetical protein
MNAAPSFSHHLHLPKSKLKIKNTSLLCVHIARRSVCCLPSAFYPSCSMLAELWTLNPRTLYQMDSALGNSLRRGPDPFPLSARVIIFFVVNHHFSAAPNCLFNHVPIFPATSVLGRRLLLSRGVRPQSSTLEGPRSRLCKPGRDSRCRRISFRKPRWWAPQVWVRLQQGHQQQQQQQQKQNFSSNPVE